jgi:hypothetical protein
MCTVLYCTVYCVMVSKVVWNSYSRMDKHGFSCDKSDR